MASLDVEIRKWKRAASAVSLRKSLLTLLDTRSRESKAASVALGVEIAMRDLILAVDGYADASDFADQLVRHLIEAHHDGKLRGWA